MSVDTKMPEKIFGIETALITMFIPPLVLVVIIIMSIGLIITPKIDEINNISNSTKQKITKTKDYNDKRSYLMAIDQEEVKAQEELLNSGLMREKDAYSLVNVIRTIADKHGFVVDSFSISPGNLLGGQSDDKKKKKVDSNTATVPVTLTLKGPSDKYIEMLFGLEKSLPIMSLESFDMNSNSAIASLNLTVAAYYIEDSDNSNTANFTLADLTLKDEEKAILTTLKDYQINTIGSSVASKSADYMRYSRENPFNF